MKRVISAVLVFCMMFSLLSTIPATASAEGAQGTTNEISNLINKVADGLDENDQTNVTLTVPGTTDNLGMDIVYITGGSLSEEIAKADVKIQNLKDTIEDSIKNGTPVNFGIVTYSYTLGVAMPLTQFKTVEDLEDFEKIIGEAYAKIQAAHNWNDGTGNMEQALINAKKMLTEQNPLKDHPERQHIVLYSSGQTYEFNTGVNNDIPGCAPVYVTKAGNNTWSDMYWGGSQWGWIRNGGSSRYWIPTNIVKEYTANKEKYASDWDCYWSYITKWVEADRAEESSATPHFYAWKGEMDAQGYAAYSFSDLTAEQKQKYPHIALTYDGRHTFASEGYETDWETAHAFSFERAMYEAYEYAKPNIIDAGINFHPIYVPIAGNASYINGYSNRNYVGHCFMDMLAGGKGKAAIYYRGSDELFFASVKEQILYSTDVGSWVEDYIGYEEGKGNFDFITNLDGIKLVVGGVPYETKEVATKAGADLSLAFNAPEAEATFWLDYYHGDGETTEKFIWTFGEAVSLARPASLTYKLQLTEKREEIGTYTVPTNNYAIFHPVDSNKQEGPIQYFRVPTVTYTVAPITVSGVKVWNDNNNQDGLRPEEIRIYLYANGQQVASVVTNAQKNWEWYFDNLQAVRNGEAITYTVAEEGVPEYTTVITGNVTDGFTITNTHAPAKTEVKVEKVWRDNDNQDGIRPSSIAIELLANGQPTGKTVVLGAANNWTAEFTNLDVKANGNAITYTVKELEVDGYDADITGDATDGFVITNTHAPAKTEVKVEKVWRDENDQDGIRPGRVTIELLANGQPTGKTVVLSAANNWTAMFTDLDKCANGNAITYTVKEIEEVEGYTTVITGNADDGFVVTNTHLVSKTGIAVNKVWKDNDNQDGIRPDSITIELLANGRPTGKVVVLNAANSWTAEFTDLYVNANGNAITYTVQEIEVEGYDTEITGDATDGFTIINTHAPAKTEVKVEKVWNDDNDHDRIRPDHVTIKLLANGQDTGKTVVLSAANGWTAEFTDLDKNANGNAITYTVQEVAVSGYEPEITGDAVNGFVVTNTHVPEKTEVKVEKVWIDNNNQDASRPGHVTIKLFANGQDTGKTIILNAANNWTAIFTDLDLNANGNAITYTVQEIEVKGYTTVITGNAVDGFTVTNTHRVDKTGVRVTKVWRDDNDQDGIRPDSITIKLFANGQDTGRTVVLSAANNWTARFANLDVNANGVKIVYTVKEIEVEGYTTEITGSAKDGFFITNTHKVEKTEVKVNKVWSDNDNQDGIRPNSVTIELLANDRPTGKTVVLSAANNWTATFADLYANANGAEIKYTVQEVAVFGYEPDITGNAKDGFTVTNIHQTEKTEVKVNKVWKDNNDQDGIRPDSITIELFANGQPTGKTVVLSEETDWTATFTGLDLKANGNDIVYTVREVAVEGYTPSYDGFTVTNTHIASTSLTLGGIKYLDNVIAEGFTFVLADANGKILGTVNSTADGKFTFGAITYTEAGSYEYTIAEVVGDDEDIYYDVSVYTVKVTVIVDGEKLVASYTLSKDNAEYQGDVEFRNETLTEIEDEDLPEHDSPDTGDNIGIFMMLGALSVTAFFAMNIFEKSRRKTN